LYYIHEREIWRAQFDWLKFKWFKTACLSRTVLYICIKLHASVCVFFLEWSQEVFNIDWHFHVCMTYIQSVVMVNQMCKTIEIMLLWWCSRSQWKLVRLASHRTNTIHRKNIIIVTWHHLTKLSICNLNCWKWSYLSSTLCNKTIMQYVFNLECSYYEISIPWKIATMITSIYDMYYKKKTWLYSENTAHRFIAGDI